MPDSRNTSINVYDIYHTMSDNNILLIYQGIFDQEMVKSVLTMTERKLILDNVLETTRKKLFNIMIEGLQNICKHQKKEDDGMNYPFFIIGKDKEGFNIVTGNVIDSAKVEVVKNKIDFINTLNPDQLKDHYKQARLNSTISSVGGAGLGFIDMARKSGNKLDYRFYDIDESYSFFILNNKINHN